MGGLQQNRPAEVAAIRKRLKQALTPQEAVEKMEAPDYGSGGYTGRYDDNYFLAAHEYDVAHGACSTARMPETCNERYMTFRFDGDTLCTEENSNHAFAHESDMAVWKRI